MVEIQDGGSHEQEIVIYQPVCNVAARLFDDYTILMHSKSMSLIKLFFVIIL